MLGSAMTSSAVSRFEPVVFTLLAALEQSVESIDSLQIFDGTCFAEYVMAKPIPFSFVLDELAELNPRTNPMFGCTAIYIGPKIIGVLRERESSPVDNGMWLCTSPD